MKSAEQRRERASHDEPQAPAWRFDDLNTSGLVRPAAEKFAGAWLACSLVMARGNVLAAFSLEHMTTASICGIVGAVVTVLLLLQMDRTTDSVYRQATIAGVATFIGDTFAHSSHFPPQWAEPLVTGGSVGQHRGRGLARQAVREERPRARKRRTLRS